MTTILDAALPKDHRQWRNTPPTKAGEYKWRLSCKWEPVQRDIGQDGFTYSHRFVQRVNPIRVEGEWFY